MTYHCPREKQTPLRKSWSMLEVGCKKKDEKTDSRRSVGRSNVGTKEVDGAIDKSGVERKPRNRMVRRPSLAMIRGTTIREYNTITGCFNENSHTLIVFNNTVIKN